MIGSHLYNSQKIHHVVPALQRHMRAMEGRSNGRVNVMPAPLAAIGALAGDAMKLAGLAAFRAIKRLAELRRARLFVSVMVKYDEENGNARPGT